MTGETSVVGVGNAMVDILARCDDRKLDEWGVQKGIMQLIDSPRAAELRTLMGSASEVSGGSAANTVSGLADLLGPSGQTAYVGKVSDDRLGHVFARDIRSLGVEYQTPMASSRDPGEIVDGSSGGRMAAELLAPPGTGCCMVLVTPDGERSMNTYLGASEYLGPGDIDVDKMKRAEWLYLEGYRFDGPDSQAAFTRAIDACKAGGGRVSLTLSDPFCVERHRVAFRTLVRDRVDLLFCNQHELRALYEMEGLDEAIAVAEAEVDSLACTLGGEGAVVASGGVRNRVPTPAVPVVDVTGAGDLFAAGFLFGVLSARPIETCARMGCLAASAVISHIGARPETNLQVLFRRKGFA